jgi:phosphoglycolate phosphatase
MTVRALLFDLDGTLVDSLEDLTDAANHIRQFYTQPVLDLCDIRLMIGKGSRNLIQQALPGFPEIDIDRALAMFLDFNRQHIAEKSRLYPGMREELRKLADGGAKLAVITNKNEELCALLLHDLGIDGLFEFMCGGDTYPERKPSPLPLLNVAEKLNIAPGDCVMIGDSINDIEAGRRAGMTTIACSWGYGSSSELDEADQLVHTPREMSEAVARLMTRHV